MTPSMIQRLLRPLAVRVANLVGRAVVKAADDAPKVQELQLELLEGELRDQVERFGEYGFTSVPLEGAECAVIFVGGRRDHGLAIGVEDRRYRIKNLESGEVAVYNHTGAKIVLKASGDVEITPKAGQKLKISADVEVTGTLTASVDVKAGTISLSGHTHSFTDVTPGGSVASVTGGPIP